MLLSWWRHWRSRPIRTTSASRSTHSWRGVSSSTAVFKWPFYFFHSKKKKKRGFQVVQIDEYFKFRLHHCTTLEANNTHSCHCVPLLPCVISCKTRQQPNSWRMNKKIWNRMSKSINCDLNCNKRNNTNPMAVAVGQWRTSRRRPPVFQLKSPRSGSIWRQHVSTHTVHTDGAISSSSFVVSPSFSSRRRAALLEKKKSPLLLLLLLLLLCWYATTPRDKRRGLCCSIPPCLPPPSTRSSRYDGIGKRVLYIFWWYEIPVARAARGPRNPEFYASL